MKSKEFHITISFEHFENNGFQNQRDQNQNVSATLPKFYKFWPQSFGVNSSGAKSPELYSLFPTRAHVLPSVLSRSPPDSPSPVCTRNSNCIAIPQSFSLNPPMEPSPGCPLSTRRYLALLGRSARIGKSKSRAGDTALLGNQSPAFARAERISKRSNRPVEDFGFSFWVLLVLSSQNRRAQKSNGNWLPLRGHRARRNIIKYGRGRNVKMWKCQSRQSSDHENCSFPQFVFIHTHILNSQRKKS